MKIRILDIIFEIKDAAWPPREEKQPPEAEQIFPDKTVECDDCGTSYEFKPGITYCASCGQPIGRNVPSLKWAREQDGLYLIIQHEPYSEWVYLTCPMRKVLCDYETIRTLGRQFVEIEEGTTFARFEENEIVYRPYIDIDEYQIGDTVPAAVGYQGHIMNDVWISKNFHKKGLLQPIKEVLQGKRESLLDYVIQSWLEQEAAAEKHYPDQDKIDYFYRGKLYFEKGDYKKAETDFRKVIELAQDELYAPMYCMLAATCYKQGKEMQAKEYFKKSMELDERYSGDVWRICGGEPLTYVHSYPKQAYEVIKELQNLI